MNYDDDVIPTLVAERNEWKSRALAAEKKIAESVFNCPGCGDHDFGLMRDQKMAEGCKKCLDRQHRAEQDRARLRSVLTECVAFMAGNTMSSDDVNCHCVFCAEDVVRGVGCEHEECRQGAALVAARRALDAARREP